MKKQMNCQKVDGQKVINNLTIYKCLICNKTSSQKSHHLLHLKSKSHKKEEEIFNLKLLNKTKEDLEKEYQNTNIQAIISDYKNKKIYNDIETVNELNKDTLTIKKKKLENKLIWTKPETEIKEDKKYLVYKNKLESIIKRCHDILYSNGSIIGIKAMNDIMRLLTLKLFEYKFNDKSSNLYNKCIQIDKEEYDIYMKYCQNFKKLAEEEDFKNEWEDLIEFLRINNILNNIYGEEDKTFYSDSSETLRELVNVIDEIDIDDNFINSYGTNYE